MSLSLSPSIFPFFFLCFLKAVVGENFYNVTAGGCESPRLLLANNWVLVNPDLDEAGFHMFAQVSSTTTLASVNGTRDFTWSVALCGGFGTVPLRVVLDVQMPVNQVHQPNIGGHKHLNITVVREKSFASPATTMWFTLTGTPTTISCTGSGTTSTKATPKDSTVVSQEPQDRFAPNAAVWVGICLALLVALSPLLCLIWRRRSRPPCIDLEREFPPIIRYGSSGCGSSPTHQDCYPMSTSNPPAPFGSSIQTIQLPPPPPTHPSVYDIRRASLDHDHPLTMMIVQRHEIPS